MFDSSAYDGKNLLFKDSTMELVPIVGQSYQAWLGEEYMHVVRGLDCDPTSMGHLGVVSLGKSGGSFISESAPGWRGRPGSWVGEKEPPGLSRGSAMGQGRQTSLGVCGQGGFVVRAASCGREFHRGILCCLKKGFLLSVRSLPMFSFRRGPPILVLGEREETVSLSTCSMPGRIL